MSVRKSNSEILRGRLLKHLAQDVWARIGPSKHGVGVIAIRNIASGQIVDRVPGEVLPQAQRRMVHSTRISEEEMSSLPDEVRSYVDELYVCSDNSVDMCSLGMNSFIGLSHFINHSDTPNVIFANSPESDETDVGFNMKVQTICDIAKGEEVCRDSIWIGVFWASF